MRCSDSARHCGAQGHHPALQLTSWASLGRLAPHSIPLALLAHPPCGKPRTFLLSDLVPLGLDAVPRAQAPAAVPRGLGKGTGSTQHRGGHQKCSAWEMALAALGMGGTPGALCGEGAGSAVHRAAALLSLLSAQVTAEPRPPHWAGTRRASMLLGSVSVAAGTGRAGESSTRLRQLCWGAQNALSPTDRCWPGGEAPEENREAGRTSTLNQHVQELVHLLTSCHLLQQTTKRRVEGIRRRVPPATSQVDGSRPQKRWL